MVHMPPAIAVALKFYVSRIPGASDTHECYTLCFTYGLNHTAST